MPTLAVFALKHLSTCMTYFLYLTQMGVKATSVCRTFLLIKSVCCKNASVSRALVYFLFNLVSFSILAF